MIYQSGTGTMRTSQIISNLRDLQYAIGPISKSERFTRMLFDEDRKEPWLRDFVLLSNAPGPAQGIVEQRILMTRRFPVVAFLISNFPKLPKQFLFNGMHDFLEVYLSGPSDLSPQYLDFRTVFENRFNLYIAGGADINGHLTLQNAFHGYTLLHLMSKTFYRHDLSPEFHTNSHLLIPPYVLAVLKKNNFNRSMKIEGDYLAGANDVQISFESFIYRSCFQMLRFVLRIGQFATWDCRTDNDSGEPLYLPGVSASDVSRLSMLFWLAGMRLSDDTHFRNFNFGEPSSMHSEGEYTSLEFESIQLHSNAFAELVNVYTRLGVPLQKIKELVQVLLPLVDPNEFMSRRADHFPRFHTGVDFVYYYFNSLGDGFVTADFDFNSFGDGFGVASASELLPGVLSELGMETLEGRCLGVDRI